MRAFTLRVVATEQVELGVDGKMGDISNSTSSSSNSKISDLKHAKVTMGGHTMAELDIPVQS